MNVRLFTIKTTASKPGTEETDTGGAVGGENGREESQVQNTKRDWSGRPGPPQALRAGTGGTRGLRETEEETGARSPPE